jgi:hypothetical protein
MTNDAFWGTHFRSFSRNSRAKPPQPVDRARLVTILEKGEVSVIAFFEGMPKLDE